MCEEKIGQKLELALMQLFDHGFGRRNRIRHGVAGKRRSGLLGPVDPAQKIFGIFDLADRPLIGRDFGQLCASLGTRPRVPVRLRLPE
jgi:hypothetical protein